MADLFIGGKFQAVDAAGIAAPGALLYTYAAGTLNPLATYTNQGGGSSNTNPVVCDAAGQANVWLSTSPYRMVLKTAAGVTIWDVDNIRDSVGSLSDSTSPTNGDALVAVKRTAVGAVATNLHYWIDGQVFNYKADFGGVCDGVTDETTTLQAALTALPVGAALWLGGDINFTSVNLAKYRCKLIGDARMRGTINVTSDGSVGQSSYFVIDGLMFNPTAEDQTIDAITVTNAAYGAIRNCSARGSRYFVYVPPRATQPYFQDVNRIEVTSCQYDYVSRFIYNTYTGLAGNYGLGDWTIKGNRGLALVDHIKGTKWDGATIADNTFFFSIPANLASPTATELLKRRGIDLTNSPYLTIHDNKIFEAGADGILLTDCNFFDIHDNTIAYPGGIVDGLGINIAYTSLPTLNSGAVMNDTIIRPSTGGVKLGDNSRDIVVAGTIVRQPGANDHAITGPTLVTKGVIVTNTNTVNNKVSDCHTTNGTYDFSDGTGNTFENNFYETVAGNKRIRFTRTRSVQAGAASPQTTAADEVDRIDYNVAIQVNGITAAVTVGFGYRRVVAYFSAGGCTLVNSASFVLKGGVNATPAAGSYIEFEIVEGGATREVWRNY